MSFIKLIPFKLQIWKEANLSKLNSKFLPCSLISSVRIVRENRRSRLGNKMITRQYSSIWHTQKAAFQVPKKVIATQKLQTKNQWNPKQKAYYSKAGSSKTNIKLSPEKLNGKQRNRNQSQKMNRISDFTEFPYIQYFVAKNSLFFFFFLLFNSFLHRSLDF